MKLKKIYDDEKKEIIAVRIDLLNLWHNHEFVDRDEEKQHYQCNKQREPEFMEFVGAMQDSRVPTHCIEDIISNMHGGPENVPMTRQDLRNM